MRNCPKCMNPISLTERSLSECSKCNLQFCASHYDASNKIIFDWLNEVQMYLQKVDKSTNCELQRLDNVYYINFIASFSENNRVSFEVGIDEIKESEDMATMYFAAKVLDNLIWKKLNS